MSRILLYSHDLFKGDAVGNYLFDFAAYLSSANHQVHIFAENFNEVDFIYDIRLINDFNVNKNDLLIIFYSIYDPNITFLKKLPCNKNLYFHNITNPKFLNCIDKKTKNLCQLGILQIKELNFFKKYFFNSQLTRNFYRSILKIKKGYLLPPFLPISEIFLFKKYIKFIYTKNYSAISVGRITSHKNHFAQIDLISILKKKYNINIFLNIVGPIIDNHYYKELLHYISSKKLLNNIFFHNFLLTNNLIQLLHSSDFILSTSLHEGYFIPAIEAQYYGIPFFSLKGTASDEINFGISKSFDNIDDIASFLNNFYSGKDLSKNDLHYRAVKYINSFNYSDLIY